MSAATTAKRAGKSAAQPVAPCLPSFQQMVALAIAKLDHDLQLAIEVMRKDEEACDQDCDADVTLCLAGDAVTRMKAMTFADYSDFSAQWILATAAIKLVAKTHSRLNSYFGRVLVGVRDDVEVLLGLVEFASLQDKLRAHEGA